jgi:NAD(P)-dependent dehydrogenase (short-subunit alcohol dehydrogenase family)
MNRRGSTLLFALLVLAVGQCAAADDTKPAGADAKRKAVLVTGASTGIGRNMVETLAKNGYFVYAGARKPKDLEALNAIPNVEGVKLDVTVQADIDAAVETVRKGGRGLHGLVNNAGIAVIGPLIEVEEADLRDQLEVNVMGPYRVTRAFAPLIIEGKGRIVTTGSISGTLAGRMLGPYAMSKHAVEAYTDALAAEMEKFGVGVSVLEPGNYKSDIFMAVGKRLESREFDPAKSRYAEEWKTSLARPKDRAQYPEPDAVSAALMHALGDPKPQRRYMVVPIQREAEITVRKSLEKTVQLNAKQAFAYDREALIKMLDEVLAANPPK